MTIFQLKFIFLSFLHKCATQNEKKSLEALKKVKNYEITRELFDGIFVHVDVKQGMVKGIISKN